ncbi:hypothetical protein BDZ45DRAFT_736108 [Acephala macrosclerotiorum]|nr:hypothetical protein BDZ45DRAFT_736108 [Acephala macrosclerotiorum]
MNKLPVVYVASRIVSGWYQLLNQSVPSQEYTAWLELELLGSASRTVFRTVAAQLVKEQYTQSRNESQVGSLSFVQQCLCFIDVSLRLMEGFLVILIVVCLLLLWTSDKPLARSYGSIGSLASILACNSSFHVVLSGSGSFTNQATTERLHGLTLWTVAGPHTSSSPAIRSSSQASINSTEVTPVPMDVNDVSKWWYASATRLSFRCATMVLPMLMIIALEITYAYSDAHSGIVDAPVNEYGQLACVYILALIMLGTSSLFVALESNAKSIDPYRELSRGRTTSKTTRDGLCTCGCSGDCTDSWPVDDRIVIPVRNLTGFNIQGLNSSDISNTAPGAFRLASYRGTRIIPTYVGTEVQLYNSSNMTSPVSLGKLELVFVIDYITDLYPASNLSVVHCVPYVESVLVDTSFNASTLEMIDVPVIGDASPVYLKDDNRIPAAIGMNIPSDL